MSYDGGPSIHPITIDDPLFKIFPGGSFIGFYYFLKYIEWVAPEHITHREEDA